MSKRNVASRAPLVNGRSDSDGPGASAEPSHVGDAAEPAHVGAGATTPEPSPAVADAARLDVSAFAAQPATPPPSTSGPDPFDLESLRLSQDELGTAGLGVKKALLCVPVRKPDKFWFCRVHPDAAYRLSTFTIELKEEREVYLVARPLWEALAARNAMRPKLLVTAINRQGTLFLWEVSLPRSDGRTDEWSRTALEAVEMATRQWVCVSANMNLGAYDVWPATGNLGEPAWPEVPFNDLLKIAFKDRLISDWDHPVLQKLRGEV
jgi:hypothetical protein